MQDKALRRKIVEDVCKDRNTDPTVVLELLELETDHRDLFVWGSRPDLRRDIERILDKELERQRDAAGS